MKTLILAAGIAMLATAGAAAAQPPAPAPLSRPDRPDRNADISRADVAARADRRFARLDLDRDGRFTPQEAQQLRAQRREQRAERMFERLDLNRDGNITREEMAQARAQRAERRTARGAEAGERRGPGQRLMRGGPRGGHGMRMGMRGGRHGAAMGARMNARMFGEQGFVTAEQMRDRALARFDRLDTDRNGVVTVTERQQARQHMRERFRQRMQERRGDNG